MAINFTQFERIIEQAFKNVAFAPPIAATTSLPISPPASPLASSPTSSPTSLPTYLPQVEEDIRVIVVQSDKTPCNRYMRKRWRMP